MWNVRRMMERHDIDKLRSLSCESVAQRLDVSCSRDVCKSQTEGLQVTSGGFASHERQGPGGREL